MNIRIKRGICLYCWHEYGLQQQMIEAGKKAEPMWAFVGPKSHRQLVAERKFRDAQKQKCMMFGEVGICYEHLSRLTRRLRKNLEKKK